MHNDHPALDAKIRYLAAQLNLKSHPCAPIAVTLVLPSSVASFVPLFLCPCCIVRFVLSFSPFVLFFMSVFACPAFHFSSFTVFAAILGICLWHILRCFQNGVEIVGPVKMLHTCIDMEGHVGADGKFYVVDCARLFPPTVPTGLSLSFSSFPFCLSVCLPVSPILSL